MLFTYHHSDNSECLAGEHFIEALIPTWHLLDLQYRNVVALEGTVANLQASGRKKTKQKTTIRHIGETEKAFKLPVIFIKSMCSVEKFGDADFNLCGRSIISHNSKGVLGPHFTRVVAGVGPHVLTQGPDV